MSKPRDPHDDTHYSPDILSVKLNVNLSYQKVCDRFMDLGQMTLIDAELELYVLHIHNGADIEDVKQKCSAMPEVEYAERCTRKRLV